MKSRFHQLNWRFSATNDRPTNASHGFTLVELVAVIAVLAMLSALLLPALAGAKAGNLRAHCARNLSQLGVGFSAYIQDHNDMFPPAAYETTGGGGVLAWDSWLHRYLGGTVSDLDLMIGVLPETDAPRIERCPADVLPSIGWVLSGFGDGIPFARRSYAMPFAGPWGVGIQISTQGQKYPLPRPNYNVGVYWKDGGLLASGLPDWEAKGYRTSVVKDPRNTLLLVEEPANAQTVANIWPSFSQGPMTAATADETYQMNPTMPVPNPSQNVNYGAHTYRVHGNRFNYLFHDNHVEPLQIEQTIGTGTTGSPKGMWTLPVND
jgi:prepilin-type N-terminal cleavage/methylation domain-containing protein/prepilin-type processing-associated H-X9-DG protein